MKKITLLAFLSVLSTSLSRAQSAENQYQTAQDYLRKFYNSKDQVDGNSAIMEYQKVSKSSPGSDLSIIASLKIAEIHEMLDAPQLAKQYYHKVLNHNYLVNVLGKSKRDSPDWQSYQSYKRWATKGLIKNLVGLEEYKKALRQLKKLSKIGFPSGLCGLAVSDEEFFTLTYHLKCYLGIGETGIAYDLIKTKIQFASNSSEEVHPYSTYTLSELAYSSVIKKHFSADSIRSAIEQALSAIEIEASPVLLARARSYTPTQLKNLRTWEYVTVKTRLFQNELFLFDASGTQINSIPGQFILGKISMEELKKHYQTVLMNSNLVKHLMES